MGDVPEAGTTEFDGVAISAAQPVRSRPLWALRQRGPDRHQRTRPDFERVDRAFRLAQPDCGPAADQLQKPTRVSARPAPVAQLDRALPSEGKGPPFESGRVRQLLLDAFVPSHFAGQKRKASLAFQLATEYGATSDTWLAI
jgi:hypothetical protein